jgi:hypothetical protein
MSSPSRNYTFWNALCPYLRKKTRSVSRATHPEAVAVSEPVAAAAATTPGKAKQHEPIAKMTATGHAGYVWSPSKELDIDVCSVRSDLAGRFIICRGKNEIWSPRHLFSLSGGHDDSRRL